MAPERGGADWETVKRLLGEALELPTGERAAFLDRECAGDAGLRAELDSLLPDEDTERRFLARPATELFQARGPETGQVLGGYLLGERIGEGGMGRVFAATQERPHRTVAIKVLRPGFLGADAERRFEWEVEALGRLAHPAIARVHDAGVADVGGAPLPWFAMERVHGRPLLAAADALGLDRAARLRLFLAVCDGVAHAHQHGVIHRDLKPENLLVDDEGAPHILDFGIARAADPMASTVTTAGEIVGTLAYMSPEQVLGEPDKVDARTDVYALGVLLYRLLTGRAPIELEGLALPEVARRLHDEEPVPASRHDRTLRGDLETILATALAKDADERYGSVDRLAADVRRHLTDEPISARPPTALYQLAKLARRHRGLAAGLLLSLLLLLVAVAGTTAGMLRASRAQARAEAERDRARAANRLLAAVFEGASPELGGRDLLVVDLLATAGAELETNEDLDPPVRASLHFTLGRTFQQLGLPEEADAQLAQATRLFRAHDGASAETTIEAAAAWAEVLYALGEHARADELASEVSDAVAGLEDPPGWVRMRPLELAATALDARGDRPAYARRARELYEAWRAVPGREGADALDTARNNLAVALLEVGEAAEAAELLRESVAARTDRWGARHPRTLVQRVNLASSLAEIGAAAEAVRAFEELVPLAEQTWGPRHELTFSARNNYAGALSALGLREEACDVYAALVPLHVEAYGSDHPETRVARNNLAVAAMQLERFAAAEEELRRILRAPDLDADPLFRARVEMNLASALSGLGRRDEALDPSRRALATLEQVVGPGNMQTLVARNNHMMLLLDLARPDDALAFARENLALAEEHHPGHPNNTFPFRSNLGRVLTELGRYEEAVRELRAAEAALPEQPAEPLRKCRNLLVEAYEAWGRPADAAEVRRALDAPPHSTR